jgi:hypothetical protein
MMFEGSACGKPATNIRSPKCALKMMNGDSESKDFKRGWLATVLMHVANKVESPKVFKEVLNV